MARAAIDHAEKTHVIPRLTLPRLPIFFSQALQGRGGILGYHPCATFWADESLVLVFHHVALSKRMGHESFSFWTLFHVVGVFSSIACLLPLRATLNGVTFGNQSFLACSRVEMGIRAVRLRDAFGLCVFYETYVIIPLFLLRSGLWQRGARFGRYVAKRVYEASRSTLFEVRLIFVPQNRAQAV